MLKSNNSNNQRGALNLLLLAAAVGILALVGIVTFLPFKNTLFSSLYPKESSHASGGVDLSISPDNLTIENGKTFLVDVGIDAKTDQPTAMSMQIIWNSQILQLVSIEKGPFFTDELVPASVVAQGNSVIATYAQKPNQFKSGSGSVATLQFKAVGTGSSQILIDADTTQVAAIGVTGNVIGLINNSNITVSPTSTVTKNAQFNLSPASGNIGTTEFPVQVQVKNPTDAANLFSARIKFDPAKLEITRIQTNGGFITQWVSGVDSFNNNAGTASIIGGVQNPGYTTGASSETLGTIYFRSKAASGQAAISFDGTSAVYRNSDNVDILQSSTAGNYTLIGVAPTPTLTPTSSPTPAPSGSVSPSSTPSSSPIASASSAPGTCSITSATWLTSANPIAEKKIVNLKAVGFGNCSGKTVSFSVLEDDGVLGTDPVKGKPTTPVKFSSNNEAVSSWYTEFQNDGFGGLSNPPEYFFTAGITGGLTGVISSSPQLQVTELTSGQHPVGDLNTDGNIDLSDLSVLLTNWDSQNGIDDYDTNEDGKINTFDFSFIVQVLKFEGVIQ